jgi:hypothetical protein
MESKRRALFFLIFLLLPAVLAAAPGIARAAVFPADFPGERQDNKIQTRWTLFDWLAQKEHMALLDSWLAVNRQANIFEIFGGGGPEFFHYKSTSNGTTTETSEKGSLYRAGLYAWNFGLEGEYENTGNHLEGMAGIAAIRLLGTSNQGTNLTVKYGMRRLVDSGDATEYQWRNHLAEGTLTLYLFSFFGLHGGYRHYFKATSNTGAVDMEGGRAMGGGFIELGWLRLYGELFKETMERDDGTTLTEKERAGVAAGGTLYF